MFPWATLLAGCHKGGETEAAPTEMPQVEPGPAPSEQPSQPPADESLSAMIRALSVRDGEPSCAEVEALSPDPVASMRQIVATVQMPPTVPMRAASCLLRGHGAEIEADLLSWVSAPETLGLAQLVAGDIDSLPPDLGKRVAERALAGPLAEKLQPKLAESANAEIKALSGP